ncbi:MAG TPA: hypothetical protein VLW85_20975 [Myxococcales bacterium]|nr:hypothetical protein [Myxococcales bacterium]
MGAESLEDFRACELAAGADEVVERRWGPGQVVETHIHIPQGTPHDERYGPEGATYWVARRSR